MELLLTDPLAPFRFPFMQQAFAIAFAVAVPTALLSCFLVLKGWSLMGDAVSHAVLPGVVLAYLVGLPFGIGAFIAGMACALGVGFLREHSRVKEDTLMGVVFSGMFALGIVLYTQIRTDVHLDHILFGNMLGIAWADVAQAAIISLGVTLLLAAKWRDLMLFVFDPQQAGALGLSTRLLHYGLLAILSLTIVAALQAVGIILVVALLVGPGAIAFLLSRRFGRMLWAALALSVGCSLLGVYLSFFIDSAPAPTILLLLTACFIAAFIGTTLRARRAGTQAASL